MKLVFEFFVVVVFVVFEDGGILVELRKKQI
jgi:hypothetical protein